MPILGAEGARASAVPHCHPRLRDWGPQTGLSGLICNGQGTGWGLWLGAQPHVYTACLPLNLLLTWPWTSLGVLLVGHQVLDFGVPITG